jgi:hypothetical protein
MASLGWLSIEQIVTTPEQEQPGRATAVSHLEECRDQPWTERSISLAPAFAALRDYWEVILGSIILAGVLAASLAIALPKYEASGFYYTPGWSLAEYKRLRSEFGSSDTLRAYFIDEQHGKSAAALLLMARSEDPRFWEKSVKPLYPITRKGTKEIFESTKDKETSAIMGLELDVSGRQADIARDAVVTLGEYLTQTLLQTTLQNWISLGQSARGGELLKAEDQVLQFGAGLAGLFNWWGHTRQQSPPERMPSHALPRVAE